MYRLSLAFLLVLPLGYPYQNPVPARAVITLQRGPCERRCAVYKVAIFGDGTVIFDGQYYVRKPGPAKARISSDQVGALIAEFRAIDYFDLKDQTCNQADADAPTVITSIALGGQGKSVLHDLGCQGPVAAKLKALEDKIDKVANTARWVR